MIQQTEYNQFQKFLAKTSGSFHVLEHQIPVERQMEYFHFSNRIKQEGIPWTAGDLEAFEIDLYNPETTEEYKRRILAIFAISGDVTAYRRLECYARLAEPDMRDWAYMALMEGRIILESELSDEKQIYISTGLGGKGQKLRFYLLFPAAEGMTIEGYRRDVVEREFNFALRQVDWDIERLTIHPDYAELVVLLPLRADLKAVLDGVLKECNQYGDFLAKTYTISNMKEMNEEEIRATIRSSRGKNFLDEEQ